MSDTGGAERRPAKWLRRIARAIGSLLATFWLFVGIVSAIYESGPLTPEGAIMAGLIVISTLGIVIAWWREGIGGAIVVLSGIAHSTFAYISSGHNRAFAVLISGGPYLVTGLLFLATWHRSRVSNSGSGGVLPSS